VSYASHSPQVELIAEQLAAALGPVRSLPPRVRLWSTVTGQLVGDGELDADYWYRNSRLPVRFGEVIDTLVRQGFGVFVEMSPHPLLTVDIHQVAEQAGRDVAALGSLRRDDGGPARFLTALAEAHTSGVNVDWRPALTGGQHTELPTYPFQHQRYWLAGRPASGPVNLAGVSTGELDGTAPDWRQSLASMSKPQQGRAFRDLVREQAAAVLGHHDGDRIGPRTQFRELGFDSMAAVRLRNRLNAMTGLSVPVTTVFDHPTPVLLAGYLYRQFGQDPELGAPPETVVAKMLDSASDDEIFNFIDSEL
jgi:acyl transferase domain-containing protein